MAVVLLYKIMTFGVGIALVCLLIIPDFLVAEILTGGINVRIMNEGISR